MVQNGVVHRTTPSLLMFRFEEQMIVYMIAAALPAPASTLMMIRSTSIVIFFQFTFIKFELFD